jgi:hypothetical protein
MKHAIVRTPLVTDTEPYIWSLKLLPLLLRLFLRDEKQVLFSSFFLAYIDRVVAANINGR